MRTQIGGAQASCSCDNTDQYYASSFKCGSYLFTCPGLNGAEGVCSQSLNSGPEVHELSQEQCDAWQSLKLGDKCKLDGVPERGLSHKACYGDGSEAACKYDGGLDTCQSSSYAPPPVLETQGTDSPGSAAIVTEGGDGACDVDLNFDDMPDGGWLHDQWWESKCVKVTAFAKFVSNNENKRGFTPINGVHNAQGGAARVFDTGNADNCDSDLMTPSPKFYPGMFAPDVSCNDCCGGGPYKMTHNGTGCDFVYDNNEKIPNPYKNDKYLGKVLVIQEWHNLGGDAEEMDSCPDDTGKGGYIEFEFCEPVSLSAGRLLDVDGTESAKIEFFYSSEGDCDPPVASEVIDVGKTGDNGYWNYQYDKECVERVRFTYTGSGSVEGINYSWACPTDAPTDGPTVSPTPSPTSSPTVSPTASPTASPTPDFVQNAPPAGGGDCVHMTDAELQGTEGTDYSYNDAVTIKGQHVDEVTFSVQQVWSVNSPVPVAVQTSEGCFDTAEVGFESELEYTTACDSGYAEVTIFVGAGVSSCSLPDSGAVSYTVGMPCTPVCEPQPPECLDEPLVQIADIGEEDICIYDMNPISTTDMAGDTVTFVVSDQWTETNSIETVQVSYTDESGNAVCTTYDSVGDQFTT
ncbi:MAG: hypothetical protein SGILL_005055 [Bacillariaceae sp.]